MASDLERVQPWSNQLTLSDRQGHIVLGSLLVTARYPLQEERVGRKKMVGG